MKALRSSMFPIIIPQQTSNTIPTSDLHIRSLTTLPPSYYSSFRLRSLQPIQTLLHLLSSSPLPSRTPLPPTTLVFVATMANARLITFFVAFFFALFALVSAVPAALPAAVPAPVLAKPSLAKYPEHGRCYVHVHIFREDGWVGYVDISVYDNKLALIGDVAHVEYDYTSEEDSEPIWVYCQLGSPLGVKVNPKDLELSFKRAGDEWGRERCSAGDWDYGNWIRKMMGRSATSDWDCGFAC